jgi:hypothetical protein
MLSAEVVVIGSIPCGESRSFSNYLSLAECGAGFAQSSVWVMGRRKIKGGVYRKEGSVHGNLRMDTVGRTFLTAADGCSCPSNGVAVLSAGTKQDDRHNGASQERNSIGTVLAWMGRCLQVLVQCGYNICMCCCKHGVVFDVQLLSIAWVKTQSSEKGSFFLLCSLFHPILQTQFHPICQTQLSTNQSG